MERLWRKLRGLPDVAPHPPLSKPGGWLQRILIFHVVCLAWVFFRAPSIGRAFAFLRGAGTWTWRPEFGTSLIYLAAFAVPMILLDVLLDARQEEYPLERLPHRFRVAMALGLTLLVTVFAANQVNAFIYFQF
jgi:hypothetical protein